MVNKKVCSLLSLTSMTPMQWISSYRSCLSILIWHYPCSLSLLQQTTLFCLRLDQVGLLASWCLKHCLFVIWLDSKIYLDHGLDSVRLTLVLSFSKVTLVATVLLLRVSNLDATGFVGWLSLTSLTTICTGTFGLGNSHCTCQSFGCDRWLFNPSLDDTAQFYVARHQHRCYWLQLSYQAVGKIGQDCRSASCLKCNESQEPRHLRQRKPMVRHDSDYCVVGWLIEIVGSRQVRCDGRSGLVARLLSWVAWVDRRGGLTVGCSF